MAKTTADVLFERLVGWGVDTVFGMPGDGINGFMEALRKLREKVRFIRSVTRKADLRGVRLRKVTGRLGVCIATSGPGRSTCSTGCTTPSLTTVLAVTGQTYHDMMGMRYQQEVNLLGLFTDVSVFNQQINGPLRAGTCRRRLPRGTRVEGVAHLNLPQRLAGDLTGKDSSDAEVAGHTSRAWSPPIVVPQEESLRSAAELLNSGERTVLLVGQGALGAGDEVEKVAETLGGSRGKGPARQGGHPRRLAVHDGGLGLLGTYPSEKAMEECDSLFMIRTSFLT
ncbi:MAG: thiamine pyrophosphate-binding protein [Isosphaeraceae bacterium]